MAKLRKTIEYGLYLLIFLLPWQTRWIWKLGEWEYLSKSLYGTEVLLGLILLLSIIYLFKNIKKCGVKNEERGIIFVFIFLFSPILLSAALAEDSALAFYYLSKIIGGGILIILIYYFTEFTKTAYVFIIGMALQAALGIYQFLSQSSFASKWLGLALHNAATLGTSIVETTDGRWLRAYGALPHPNILAGYLTVAILLLIILYVHENRTYLLLILTILTSALFFTFSRAAWITLIISLTFYLFISLKKQKNFRNILKLSFACLLVPVIFSFIYMPLSGARISNTNRLEIRSTSERMEYFSEGSYIIKNYPFFGAGPGNYTLAIHNLINQNRETFYYQPVHNIYLLIISEIGILGFSVFLFLCFYFFKQKINLNFIVLSPVIILGFFDHYLLTLYSGIILTSLCLSLSLKSKNIG